jgi:beta-fructofuranosidase
MLDRRRFLQASSAAAVLASNAAPAFETNPAIAKAMDGVKAAIPLAERDPERPVYHFHPPAQWNNDPNGTIQYRGWYHMFYQHNPYGAGWGNMHWGHARSRDLVNWEHLPIALWPSKEKGEEHVFSGCAALGPDGRPVIVYTSIGSNRDPEQWMAVPKDDDLIVWDKHPANPVLTTKLHKFKVNEWRDPFIFRDSGKTFVVCGGNRDPRGGYAEVQLYQAKNRELTQWEHRGAMFRDPDRAVWNIECPNFFKLDGKWVLLTSPQRSCEYFVGDFDPAAGLFTPRVWGILDPGAAYASNIIFDDKGRCLLLLWSNTQTPEDRGWCGAMLIPRVLQIGEDGHLKQTPVREFESLRGEAMTRTGVTLDNASIDVAPASHSMEFVATFEITTAKAVGLTLAGTDIVFEPESGYVTAGNKEKVFAGRDKMLTLRLFLDHRMLEVYAGGTALTHLMDPAAPGLQVFARGGAAVLRKLEAWPMKPAQFSMEQYRT